MKKSSDNSTTGNNTEVRRLVRDRHIRLTDVTAGAAYNYRGQNNNINNNDNKGMSSKRLTPVNSYQW